MVELVENHVLTETKNLIQTFSIQPDSQADGICSLIVASVNSAINLGNIALGTWGTIPGSIVSIVSTGVSVVQVAASIAAGQRGGPQGGTVAEEGKSDKTKGDSDKQTTDPDKSGDPFEYTGTGLDGHHDGDTLWNKYWCEGSSGARFCSKEKGPDWDELISQGVNFLSGISKGLEIIGLDSGPYEKPIPDDGLARVSLASIFATKPPLSSEGSIVYVY